MSWQLTIAPAYGRDYQTATQAWADWMANKDFFIKTPGHPSYINKEDAENYGLPGDQNKLTIRFNKLALFLIATFNPETKEWSYVHDEDLAEEWNRGTSDSPESVA